MLWGLWSPSFGADRKIDHSEFKRLKEIADSAHEQRLTGLYVDTNVNADGETAPKDAVSLKETQSLLAMAKLHLEQMASEGTPDVEAPDELDQWFWEVIADDERRKRLFSVSFFPKYAELKGDVHAWISWARDEFENVKKQEQELLAAELGRVVDGQSPPKEAALHKAFEEILPDPEHREVMFKHLVKPPQNPLEMQEWTISAKRIVDLYRTRKANLTISKTMEKMKEKLEQAKTSKG